MDSDSEMQCWVVTGGVGTGKTAFCRAFLENAKPWMEHFSCDEVARELWEDPGTVGRIAKAFGLSRLPEGSPAAIRSAVRSLVFRDEKARFRLEAILHPPILSRLVEAREQARKEGRAKVFLAEVPLYYEIQQSLPADTVIVVAASRTVQCIRLMEHRQLDAATCEGMLNAQLPLENKIEKADMVVWNDGSTAILEAQASMIMRDRCATHLLHHA